MNQLFYRSYIKCLRNKAYVGQSEIADVLNIVRSQ